MIKLTEEQIAGLKKWLPEQVDELLKSDNSNPVTDALDLLYLDLLDSNQEPTAESREVEQLRDHIHWDNTH